MKKKAIERGRIQMPHLGVDIPLMLGEDNQFYAMLNNHMEKGPDAHTVTVAMQRHIERVTRIDWQPYIRVKKLGPGGIGMVEDRRNVAFIGFNLIRGYVGQVPSGGWRIAGWHDGPDTDDQTRALLSHEWHLDMKQLPGGVVFPFEYTSNHDGHSYYYAYTDDLWGRLKYIQGEIERLRNALDLLLGTPEGLQRLLSANLPALLAPPKDDH